MYSLILDTPRWRPSVLALHYTFGAPEAAALTVKLIEKVRSRLPHGPGGIAHPYNTILMTDEHLPGKTRNIASSNLRLPGGHIKVKTWKDRFATNLCSLSNLQEHVDYVDQMHRARLQKFLSQNLRHTSTTSHLQVSYESLLYLTPSNSLLRCL